MDVIHYPPSYDRALRERIFRQNKIKGNARRIAIQMTPICGILRRARGHKWRIRSLQSIYTVDARWFMERLNESCDALKLPSPTNLGFKLVRQDSRSQARVYLIRGEVD